MATSTFRLQDVGLSLVIPRTLAVLFGTIFVLEGVTSLLKPAQMEKQDFGRLSGKEHEKVLFNPYVPLTHVRTATFGVLVLIFASKSQWEVVGTILSAGVFVGLADAYYAQKASGWKQGLSHLLPTGLLVGIGITLIRQG
jgi:hypothetical protein